MEHQHKTAGSIRLHSAGKWSEQGRKEVAEWLRTQADELEREGDQYADTFLARRLYQDA